MFTIPADFIEDAVGPISVKIVHDDQEATSPYDILIGDGVEITRLSPAEGKVGDSIVIEGVGFSENIAQNTVTFAGSGNTRITAKVTEASKSSLTVVVPQGTKTGAVTVEVGGSLSNEVTFTVPFVLSITFGDNGNFNDDVFKLLVDGEVKYDNASPQRQVGPIEVGMDAGIHTVQLTGIRADDGIGTYYIEFAGDVISVSGDAQEGRDLCPNVVKEYQIDIGPTTQVTSVKSNKLAVLQNETKSSKNAASECATTN